jgi:tetratricopeptide (TPR) repeat protein
MTPAKRFYCAVALLVLLAEPALAAKPSKKDINNCGGQDIEAIISGCTAVYKKSPKNPGAQAAALYNRGLAYYRAGDYQKALADHDQAIKILPKDGLNNRDLAYNLYLNRGRTKYQMKNWRGSAQDSEEATKIDGTNPMAFTNWAWALLELESFEQAKRQLDWSLAVKPDEPSARALRGIVNFYLGNYPESLEDTNEALRLNPNFPWAQSNRALYYWWMSLSDRAIADPSTPIALHEPEAGQAVQDLDAVLAGNPREAWANSTRARIMVARGEYAEAQRNIDAALAADPNNARAHMVQGFIWRRTGKLAEAKVELEKALSIDGTFIDALTTLAGMAREEKDLQGALAYYERAEKVKTTNAQDAKRRDSAIAAKQAVIEEIERPAKLAKACEARSGQETIDACNEIIRTTEDREAKLKALWNRVAAGPGGVPTIEDATAILGLDPANREALRVRGQLYNWDGIFDEALLDAEALLKLDPNDVEALVIRMTAYSGQQDFDKATADADTVLQREPNNVDALFVRVAAAKEKGDWQKVKDTADTIILAKPEIAGGWVRRAEAKQRLHDNKGAIADATRAIELSKDWYLAYTIRGMARFGEADYQEAVNDFSRALASKVDDTDALFFRGMAYLYLNNASSALSDANALLKIKPEDVPARVIRARASFLKKDYARALADASDVLSLEPNNLGMRKIRIDVRLAQKDYGGAEQEVQDALKVTGNDAQLWLLRANARYYLRDFAGALADLNRADHIRPEDEKTIGYRARLHLELGHVDEALADADTVLKTKANDPAMLSIKGEALFRRGDNVKAVEALEAALKQDQKYIRVLKLMGDIYSNIGSNDLALQYYARAIEQKPEDDIETALHEAASTARAELMQKLAKKTSQ